MNVAIRSAKNSYQEAVMKLNHTIQVLESINNFSLQNLTILNTSVTALGDVQRYVDQLVENFVKLQIENVKLQKLLSEKTTGSQESFQHTNRLIEEIQHEIMHYMLVKHNCLLKVAVAAKSVKADKTFGQKWIPNNGTKCNETQRMRINVERLWHRLDFDYE